MMAGREWVSDYSHPWNLQTTGNVVITDTVRAVTGISRVVFVCLQPFFTGTWTGVMGGIMLCVCTSYMWVLF